MKPAAVLVLCGLAAIAGPATAAPVEFGIDQQHTSVAFVLQHDAWAKYQGTIADLTGTIMFDKLDPAASSVTVSTYPRSIRTMNQQREGELRGLGFLNEDVNPKITFVSSKVELTGDKAGKITGILTMAGVGVPLTLDTVFDGDGTSSWDGAHRIGFSAKGQLNVNDFKMAGFGPLNIGPVIDFTIEVEATERGH